MGKYAIRGGLHGKRRLDVLAGTLQPTTVQLLEEIGVTSGMRCIDVATGGGHVAQALARLTGPAGSVLGVDIDAEIVDLARADAEEAGLSNAEFRVADAREIPGADYDVIYSRCLLCHLSDREQILKGMLEVVRPGGLVVLEDIDWSGCFSYPESEVFRRAADVTEEIFRSRGADVRLGPAIPGMLRQAGAKDVEFRIVHLAFDYGDAKRIHHNSLINMTDTALSEGLYTQQEIDELLSELLEFTDDQSTIIAWPRVFQVWGRKPA